jgi:hypothetical protein
MAPPGDSLARVGILWLFLRYFVLGVLDMRFLRKDAWITAGSSRVLGIQRASTKIEGFITFPLVFCVGEGRVEVESSTPFKRILGLQLQDVTGCRVL